MINCWYPVTFEAAAVALPIMLLLLPRLYYVGRYEIHTRYVIADDATPFEVREVDRKNEAFPRWFEGFQKKGSI